MYSVAFSGLFGQDKRRSPPPADFLGGGYAEATACLSFIFYRGQKFWGVFLKVLLSDLSATDEREGPLRDHRP
jgi:hypothetical protein